MCAASVLCLCACTQRIITGTADELAMYDWHCENDFGISADLHFNDDDTASFIIYENGKASLQISGLYKIDDTSLTIMPEDTFFDLNLDYKLYDDECVFTYDNYELAFKKVSKDS